MDLYRKYHPLLCEVQVIDIQRSLMTMILCHSRFKEYSSVEAELWDMREKHISFSHICCTGNRSRLWFCPSLSKHTNRGIANQFHLLSYYFLVCFISSQWLGGIKYNLRFCCIKSVKFESWYHNNMWGWYAHFQLPERVDDDLVNFWNSWIKWWFGHKNILLISCWGSLLYKMEFVTRQWGQET